MLLATGIPFAASSSDNSYQEKGSLRFFYLNRSQSWRRPVAEASGSTLFAVRFGVVGENCAWELVLINQASSGRFRCPLIPQQRHIAGGCRGSIIVARMVNEYARAKDVSQLKGWLDEMDKHALS